MTETPQRFIDPTARLGYKVRFLQGTVPWTVTADTDADDINLPESVYVGAFASIGAGAVIGNRCVIDAYCRVEPYAELGEDVLVTYRGTIGVGAKIGAHCVIGGTVSENTVVENDCTSLGRLIHTHWDSTLPWDFRDDDEPSPTIRNRSFIGHDSLIIGGIEVGPLAYVCAGAIVTKSVPPYHIASGVNRITHYSRWTGRLSQNPMFQMSL